jgi:hypothetical protein
LGLHFKKKQISLTARGKDIAAGYFFKTLTGREGIASGKLTYKLVVNGPITAPKSELELSMFNGELVHNPYEQIEISLTDSLAADSTYLHLKNHMLAVKNLKIINSGQYHLEILDFISTGIFFHSYQNGIVFLSTVSLLLLLQVKSGERPAARGFPNGRPILNGQNYG